MSKIADFMKGVFHRPYSTIGDGYDAMIVSHYPYVGEPPPVDMRVMGQGCPQTPYTFTTALVHKTRPFKGGMPEPLTYYGHGHTLAPVPRIRRYGSHEKTS